MFSKANFEVLKERALQKVQEQLEQVGVRNQYLEKRVHRLGNNQQLQELLELVEKLSKTLEDLVEAATVFHKGVCVLQESTKMTKNALDSNLVLDDALRSEGPVMTMTFDEENLRKELQNNVTKPIRLRLRELADIKHRVKEADILRLEVNSLRERVQNGAKVEDTLAQKQVQHEQMLLRLYDEHAVLKRDHQAIVRSCFNSFKMCQYRFAMSAHANLQTICTEEEEEEPKPIVLTGSIAPSKQVEEDLSENIQPNEQEKPKSASKTEVQQQQQQEENVDDTSLDDLLNLNDDLEATNDLLQAEVGKKEEESSGTDEIEM